MLLVVLLALHTGIAGGSHPDHIVETHEALLTEPSTLRGPVDVVSRVFHLDEGAVTTHDPLLEVDWYASPMLNPDTSMVTVSIGERPIRSWPLRDLIQDGTPVPIRVSLRGTKPGWVPLEIKARLRIGDDPCVRIWDDEAWMVLESADVHWHGPEAVPEDPTPVDLPEHLARNPVLVRPPPRLDDHWATATVELWQTLARWNARPIASLDELDTLEDLDEDHVLYTVELVQSPPDPILPKVRGAAALTGRTVRLSAPDGKVARDLVHAWADGGFRERCEVWPCLLGPTSPDDADELELDDGVFTLEDAGWRYGYRVEGKGSMRFRYAPPAHWRRSRPPSLHAVLRYDALRANQDQSRLEAWVAGRPFASWRLDTAANAAPRELVATLPDAVAGDAAWDIELHVAMEPDDDLPCQYQVEPWAVLEPDTRLVIPHEEPEDGSIAYFAEGLTGSDDPQIRWPDDIMPQQTLAVARVLERFTHGRRWRLDGDCDVDCVRIVHDRPDELSADPHLDAWMDWDGVDVPVITTAGHPALYSNGELLDLILPTERPIPSTAPAPLAMPSTWAMATEDGWSLYGTLPTPEVVEPDNEVQASEEEVAAATVDLLFGVFLVLFLGGGAAWVWRASTPEVEEDLPKPQSA